LTVSIVALCASLWGYAATPYRTFPGDDPLGLQASATRANPYRWRPHYLTTDMTLCAAGHLYRVFAPISPTVLSFWTIGCHCAVLLLLSGFLSRLTGGWFGPPVGLLLYAASAWTTTYLYFWFYAPIAALYGSGCVASVVLARSSPRPRVCMALGGACAALAIWSCASAVIPAAAGCLLALHANPPWRSTRDRVPLGCFLGGLAIGMSLFLVPHFRDGYLQHIVGDFEGAHLRDALRKFGRLPPPPPCYSLLIYSTYSKTLVLLLGLSTFQTCCDVVRRGFQSRSEAPSFLELAQTRLAFAVWFQILVVELLPTTKLARSYFITFPLVCALIALSVHRLSSDRFVAFRPMRATLLAMLVLISMVEGIGLSIQIDTERTAVPQYLKNSFPDERDLFVLNTDPHAPFLAGALNGSNGWRVQAVDPSFFERLADSPHPRIVLVVGPTGPASGNSILKHGSLRDFLFDVGAFARSTSATVQLLPYYAYTPAFCLEEENCQNLLYNGLIPTPQPGDGKKVAVLVWPSSERP
jgi:hypothetical protein